MKLRTLESRNFLPFFHMRLLKLRKFIPAKNCLAKSRKNFQNSSGTAKCRRVVSLQSFEHLDVISVPRRVSMDNGKLIFCPTVFFAISLTVIKGYFSDFRRCFLENRPLRRQRKNILLSLHHVQRLYSHKP